MLSSKAPFNRIPHLDFDLDHRDNATIQTKVVCFIKELKCRQRMCDDAYRASSNGSERNISYLPCYSMNATDDSLVKSSNNPRLPI